MKTLYIVFISAFFISNCSLVGVGTGALIDSENRKKHERISSKNQKITLELAGGKKVRARYRGLSYSDSPYYGYIVAMGNGRVFNNMQAFPAFGEEIVISIDSDTLQYVEGKFTGLVKQNGNYELILSPADTSQPQNIPIFGITKIKMANGNYLDPMPEPENLHLLYEKDKKTYIAPLSSLNHINWQETNFKLGLFFLGAIIDSIYLAVQINSINFDGLNFKESFEAY